MRTVYSGRSNVISAPHLLWFGQPLLIGSGLRLYYLYISTALKDFRVCDISISCVLLLCVLWSTGRSNALALCASLVIGQPLLMAPCLAASQPAGRCTSDRFVPPLDYRVLLM